jgi:hypothetical protein
MTSNPNLRTVAKTIIQNPGITVKGITKLTGLPSRSIRGALITLESCGFLISEDDQGRLYPFDPYETGPGRIVADLIVECPPSAAQLPASRHVRGRCAGQDGREGST